MWLMSQEKKKGNSCLRVDSIGRTELNLCVLKGRMARPQVEASRRQLHKPQTWHQMRRWRDVGAQHGDAVPNLDGQVLRSQETSIRRCRIRPANLDVGVVKGHALQPPLRRISGNEDEQDIVRCTVRIGGVLRRHYESSTSFKGHSFSPKYLDTMFSPTSCGL